MATRDLGPGKHQCILVTPMAHTSLSNILPLYSPYILNCSRVQSYLYIMHQRSSIGLIAFKSISE